MTKASSDLNTKPPLLTGAKQTMMSWAKVIESYEMVPEVYKPFFKTLPGGILSFPYTVLAPPLHGFRHKTTEKLICEANNTIYVLERTSTGFTAKGYPLKAIRDVEMGSILLYSWITLSGVTHEGVSSFSTVEFNAVTSERFTPFVSKIRPGTGGAGAPELRAEQAKFNDLISASFKFMNYARSSLVPGEKVLYTLWQPEIRERINIVFSLPFYQTISTAHLTILTDKELILIRDDERVTPHRGTRYGGVWQYIPLRNIASASLSRQPEGLLTLSIKLSPNGHLDRIFALSSQTEVEQLQAALQKRSA